MSSPRDIRRTIEEKLIERLSAPKAKKPRYGASVKLSDDCTCLLLCSINFQEGLRFLEPVVHIVHDPVTKLIRECGGDPVSYPYPTIVTPMRSLDRHAIPLWWEFTTQEQAAEAAEQCAELFRRTALPRLMEFVPLEGAYNALVDGRAHAANDHYVLPALLFLLGRYSESRKELERLIERDRASSTYEMIYRPFDEQFSAKLTMVDPTYDAVEIPGARSVCGGTADTWRGDDPFWLDVPTDSLGAGIRRKARLVDRNVIDTPDGDAILVEVFPPFESRAQHRPRARRERELTFALLGTPHGFESLRSWLRSKRNDQFEVRITPLNYKQASRIAVLQFHALDKSTFGRLIGRTKW